MAALSTQEKNAGVEPSQCSNIQPVPLAKRTSFDGVTIAFHWATVLVVLGLLTTALWHAQSHDDMTKALMLRIHRSLGVSVWTATAFRLVWRMTNAKLPPFPDEMTDIHRMLVKITEYCLYALLIVQPLTGFVATIARGRSFLLFWWHIPPLISHYPTLRAVLLSAHRIGAWTFGILIMGHAVAALIHYFVFRDNVLQRMAPVIGSARSVRKSSLGTRGSQTSFGR
jgi:superoxide oxidase